jgi:release factor glutamine methyltransferase
VSAQPSGQPGSGLPATVQQALQHARGLGLERLDAQVLLLHTLGRDPHDRAWLIAHDTDPLPPDLARHLQGLCKRRASGEPVAYLIGQREFHGLTLQVDARVLDPRPDTETLVDWALERLQHLPGATVLDLGTGSGAIALAIRHRCPDSQVWALDASAEALAVARANGRRLGLPVMFLQGNWLRDWEGQRQAVDQSHPQGPSLPHCFDLIVSNPPYIRTDDPHLAALTHEPLTALASGADGLDDLREIVAEAVGHLQPGGWLLLEHGWDQAEAVAALLRQAGFEAVEHRLDLAGHRRCTGGRRSASPTPPGGR